MTSRPLFEWAWVPRNLDRIWDATVQHLSLTAAAVTIGFAFSAALAGIALRWRSTRGPIIALGGILYTIPSLALFALLAPFTGLSATTAIIALASYTVLILVRNIVVAFERVPAHVVEAARGMGYTDRQIRLRVHVPLAAPVVIAGLRIAAVTVIGLVTVTALLGQGGLGQLILSGFRVLPPYPTQILVGTALSIALAVVVDIALVALERGLTPWARRT
jgi:osmoprotectant transport system permease protein